VLPHPTPHIDTGGLPSHIFTSLGAAEDTRLATAAAQLPMPLTRRSMEEAAALGAGLLKAFEREVADTQLLLVPQVGVTLTGCCSLGTGVCAGQRSPSLSVIAHLYGWLCA
jgi:hypothetical protein